jgi:general secretion pathway protein J
MKNRQAADERGFTLLELMISLTLLGVMLTMVYSVFATALASVPRGEDVAVQSARMRAATSLLTRQVRSIIPYQVEGEDESTPCYFMGNPGYFDFYTAAPQRNGGEGLAHVTYWTDGHTLWMAEVLVQSSTTDTGEQRPAPSPAAVVLLEGLTSAEFKYRRVDGTDDVDNEFRDSWDSFEEQMLPGAVRIWLTGLGVGNSYWVQEIPIMLVSYGLGAYDCESGFGNRDLEDGGSDANSNGTTPEQRRNNLPPSLRGAAEEEE